MMNDNKALKNLLDDERIRKVYDEEKWYYSVNDIVSTILELPLKDAKNYFYNLKKRLRKETGNSVFNYKKLKLVSRDGKKYLTEVADTEQVLRLLQSISSPKVEPVKTWLARIGKENLENNSV